MSKSIGQILTTREAKMCYLKGLAMISMCNGDVAEEEINYFNYAAQALQLDETDTNELNNMFVKKEKVGLKFEQKEQSLFFLREAIQLCFVDGSYNEAERAIIMEFAENMGVSVDSVLKMEAWVKEGIDWAEKGDSLLDLEV